MNGRMQDWADASRGSCRPQYRGLSTLLSSWESLIETEISDIAVTYKVLGEKKARLALMAAEPFADLTNLEPIGRVRPVICGFDR